MKTTTTESKEDRSEKYRAILQNARSRARLKVLWSKASANLLTLAASLSPAFLGSRRERITRGRDAHRHPQFYIELGQNPDELVQAGLDAIEELCNEDHTEAGI